MAIKKSIAQKRAMLPFFGRHLRLYFAGLAICLVPGRFLVLNNRKSPSGLRGPKELYHLHTSSFFREYLR
jgi:hypothetical protein